LDSGGYETQMRLEHPLDARRADPSLEAVDDALVLHEREGRNRRHMKPVGELGLLVDVDVHHAQALTFLAGDMGDQALHAAGRPGLRGPEEDEKGTRVGAQ
jgi:predicted dehydrogenase